MIKYTFSFIMAIAFIGISVEAQTIKKEKYDRIDKLAEQLLNQKKISGTSILLIKDGTVIYEKAFGFADIETKKPMETNSIFRIASQTKAITSIAAMILWEEGKFLLDEPVSKYIPAFKNPKVLVSFNAKDSSYTTKPASREITVRDLFRHTSGITYPVFSIDERFNAIYAKAGITTGIGSKGILKEEIIKLGNMPLLHNPSEAFTYGLNTDVLGYLVEIWSGKKLDVFFKERIFEPLNMNDTYFTLPKEKENRLVSVYHNLNSKLEKVKIPIYEGNEIMYPITKGIYNSGGAGLSSTTADYGKFLQMLLNKGEYNHKRLIGQKTVALLMENQLSDAVKINGMGEDFQFGLGFGLVTEKNKYLYSSSTGTFYWGGAFNTHYWADPKEGLIGLVFTQEYMPESYWDLGLLFKNTIYPYLNSESNEGR
ncbi:beta-lactamase family protein [Flavobacterium sp. LS1R49]|uniref:Beta-lactamase family protein n=1 Tax=Flavobacterium shii TaxID=2987687 RepID=A0A9X2ZFR9_9FLAO|nr:serine hydrolase domain-containing protein [Flavobacterium shii]MCV9928590.1 beta-lactamase family protein [Flavobacterium shii]